MVGAIMKVNFPALSLQKAQREGRGSRKGKLSQKGWASPLYSSMAYAPFGESYNQTGTTDLSFTGDDQDTASGMYDTLYRKQMPVQGRWLTPDPAGLGAVDPTSPQTWNRYAYTLNNPLSLVDPLGLMIAIPRGCTLMGFDENDDPVFDCTSDALQPGDNGGSGPVQPPFLGPGGGGGHLPEPKPPVLRRGQPQCFAQLKSRSVQDPRAQLVGATHSFWYVQDTLGNQYIVSAGPSNGFLDVWPTDNLNAQPDNVSATTSWNSGLSSSNCNGADDLLTSADTWPQDTIPYSPALGPNSNSAANYFGQAGGFNPSAPSGSMGWNTPILFPGQQ
jgi:RHS repeat-associated protein